MSVPALTLTPFPMPGDFAYLVRAERDQLVDFEQGGIALNDGSKGTDIQLWSGVYTAGGFVLSAPSVAPTVVWSTPGVIRFGFSFDQNMEPVIAYEDASGAHVRFFGANHQFDIQDLEAGATNICISADDNRPFNTLNRNVILGYNVGNSLNVRVQFESYATPHVLDGAFPYALTACGPGTNFRYRYRGTMFS